MSAVRSPGPQKATADGSGRQAHDLQHLPKVYICNYCLRCMKGLCLECTVKHDGMQVNHPVVDADSSFMVHIMCPKHSQQIQDFCEKCNLAICRSCKISDHGKHSVCPLIFDRSGDEVKYANEQLVEIDKMKKHFNEGIEMTNQQLKSHRIHLIDEMEKQFKQLHAKLQEKQKQVNTKLDSTKKSIIDQRDKRRPVKELPMARIDPTNTPSFIDVTEPNRVVFTGKTFDSLGEIEELAPGEFKHSFRNISKLVDEVTSPTFYVCDLPWYMFLKPEQEGNKKKFAVNVKCNKDVESPSSRKWSWKAIVQIRLVPQKTVKEPVSITLEHVFDSHNMSVGYQKVADWSTVVDQYLKDDTITVVVCVKDAKAEEIRAAMLATIAAAGKAITERAAAKSPAPVADKVATPKAAVPAKPAAGKQ